VGIQEEIHKALGEIEKKLKEGYSLTESETETLFLTSLIEEEG